MNSYQSSIRAMINRIESIEKMMGQRYPKICEIDLFGTRGGIDLLDRIPWTIQPDSHIFTLLKKRQGISLWIPMEKIPRKDFVEDISMLQGLANGTRFFLASWSIFLIASIMVSGLCLLSWDSTGKAQEGPLLPKSKVDDPLPPLNPPKALSTENREKPELFANWPKQDPECVLLLSGQIHSYLQKCGCTNPQKGGLERRYNLIEFLKTKNWEVIPLDLGDVAYSGKIREQALLKYQVSMEAMKVMGYRATTVGLEEFRLSLLDVLGRYALNNPSPPVLAANINFKDAPEIRSLLLRTGERIQTKKQISIGVVGTIGRSLFSEAQKLDHNVVFNTDGEKAVREALTQLTPIKESISLRVLLYQASQNREEGSSETIALIYAKRAIELLPEIQLVVCSSNESEAPMEPIKHQESWIVQVGQKGQHVGIVGVFKEANGKLTLRYQRVTLGPEWETPVGQEANHPILKKLQWYANEVEREKFLLQSPKGLHPTQSKHPRARFIGSESCKECHAQEFEIWAASKHAHAYQALTEIAKKPTGRNHDPECIRCHTVGFDYFSGFDGSVEKMHLKNVGCESCHGPGNLHVDAEMRKHPDRAFLYPYLSPWKDPKNPKLHLPKPEALNPLHDITSEAERRKRISVEEEGFLRRVDRVCQQCHDAENDPIFRFERFMPKIDHFHNRRGLMDPKVDKKMK